MENLVTTDIGADGWIKTDPKNFTCIDDFFDGQLFDELIRRIDDGEYDSMHGPHVNKFVRAQLMSIMEFWMKK